jgi:hypothetical protein
MKLISFDVGIKNMAYCIFSTDASISILDWNVLNLMGETNAEKHSCNCVIPPKTKKLQPKPCGKNAKYQKNDGFYCEKHAKASSQFIIPTSKNNPSNLKKLKVVDIFKLCQSHLLFLNTENPEKLLKKDLLERLVSFYEKQCFQPILVKKSKSAGETDLIEIGRNMKNSLDDINGLSDINYVVIENQISPIANRMKTIQGMLAQYFIINAPSAKIEFVSSMNKLKQFQNKNTDKSDALENTFTPVSTYKKHKTDGVDYCSQIIETHPEFQIWKHCLNTKKKDDLADCFLQGVWYMNKNKMTTITLDQ